MSSHPPADGPTPDDTIEAPVLGRPLAVGGSQPCRVELGPALPEVASLHPWNRRPTPWIIGQGDGLPAKRRTAITWV